MPQTSRKTFYQQKFRAKQETRRFHGEYLTERKWNSMFRHTLRGVIRMNPAIMAKDDGSSVVSGRGTGIDPKPLRMVQLPKDIERRRKELKDANPQPIPFMQMTYAPLERRLDTAVYRALFASSVRQARMMCLHGKVFVNGVKMPHAGYMLNPGDMFSIDPLLVMKAIGGPERKPFKQLSTQAKSDLQKAIEEAQSKTKSSTYLKSSNKKVLAGNAAAEVDTETFTAAGVKSESTTTETEGETTTSSTDKIVAEAEGDEEASAGKKKFHLPSDWRTYLPKHPRWKIYDEWRPKRFMNLFAFIPRSGGAEVPNPFNNDVMQLAFNWYLRRR
ncbi:mitochondrial 37S ribosomal protein nam9 [Orbilia oligospora]|uniref:Mitochondrial 37S ribosomal protein nam9 n=1 Tax=Orbilia oligospora TaxID=2813651 RepID=A0A7C8JRS8_ORBOL|nr:mitochondrial 37S ribosomal protein nam9 [Orbilia oligospora]